MATAFILIGPVPFLSIVPTVPLIQGSMAILGLGYLEWFWSHHLEGPRGQLSGRVLTMTWTRT